MRKFRDDIKHLTLSNGGTFKKNGIVYHFANTCSVDPWLLTIYLICCSSRIDLEHSTVNSCSRVLYETFLKIKKHLLKNDWNMARLEWAKFSETNEVTNSDNSRTFDFFLTPEEAFGNKMHHFQSFSFEYRCKKNNCTINGQIKKHTSSFFEQMLVLRKN